MTQHLLTPEEKYYRDIQQIIAENPPGSVRERLKQKRWEQYEALLFEEEAKPSLIYSAQMKFAEEYFALVKSFYEHLINDTTYQQARTALHQDYARRLFEAGLLTAVFDDAWFLTYAQESLAFERNLLPVRARPGFSDADSDLLCVPLRDFSHRFFIALHTEFGIGRLQRVPDIFGGVEKDEADRQQEKDALPSR